MPERIRHPLSTSEPVTICRACGGRGLVERNTSAVLLGPTVWYLCRDCEATGWTLVRPPCQNCNGTGYIDPYVLEELPPDACCPECGGEGTLRGDVR